MFSPKRALVVALAAAGLSPVTSAARQDAAPRHCPKLFTVKMGKRAGAVIWRGTRTPTRRNLRLLGRIEMCQRNPRAQWFVRWYDRHQGAMNRQRVWSAQHPFTYSTASWYTDAGSGTASGWHAAYGVADCGSGGGPCYPFGTRIEFCYHGCVVATVDDHGPYVSGRAWDLGQSTAQAIGFSGVDTVGWRLVG